MIGEKGTKVPNTSIAEISLELELSLAFKFDYSRSAFSLTLSDDNITVINTHALQG